MKKTIYLLLALVLIFTLSACGNNENADTEINNSSNIQQTENGPVLYADLNRLEFTFNNHKCILGETTLQDLLDYGAVLCDDGYALDKSLWYTDELVKPDWILGFDIENTPGFYFEIDVKNTSEQAKKAKDCVIHGIGLSTNEGEPHDLLSFAFPYDLTPEELIQNSGDNYTRSEYNGIITIDYSDYKDYFKYGYSFGFENDILIYLGINCAE